MPRYSASNNPGTSTSSNSGNSSSSHGDRQTIGPNYQQAIKSTPIGSIAESAIRDDRANEAIKQPTTDSGLVSKISSIVMGIGGGLAFGPGGAAAASAIGRHLGPGLYDKFTGWLDAQPDEVKAQVANPNNSQSVVERFKQETGGGNGNQYLGQPNTGTANVGITGASGAGSGIGGAVNAQLSGQQLGINEQRQSLAGTQGELDPYKTTGASALEQQQALLGLGGVDAQQAAYDAINVSPGQKFLRDRQERAVNRNAAALGQRLGGNVLTGLQEQAVGFAQQDINNQFGRLGSLSGQGLNATVAGGNFASNTASNIANLQNQSGEARASGILGEQQLKAQKSEGIANILGMFSEPIGDLAGSAFDWFSE